MSDTIRKVAAMVPATREAVEDAADLEAAMYDEMLRPSHGPPLPAALREARQLAELGRILEELRREASDPGGGYAAMDDRELADLCEHAAVSQELADWYDEGGGWGDLLAHLAVRLRQRDNEGATT